MKERQVNQITAPVEVAKKMYEMQQERLRDILVGPQTQTRKSESINGVEVKEIVRNVLSQLEIE